MKQSTNKRIFEVMQRLDKTFNPPLNEVINTDQNTDPTKEEMINYLTNEFGGLIDMVESEFDLEAAIYWFAYAYHGGQWSNLYSVLSTSPYKLSSLINDVEGEDEIVNAMYNALVDEFGGGQNDDSVDIDAELDEAKNNAAINPKYTHFAVLRSDNKIINGWDYNGYDPEDLKAGKYDYFIIDIENTDFNPKEVKVLTKNGLLNKGIDPFDINNWYKPGTEITEENDNINTYNPHYELGELEAKYNSLVKDLNNLYGYLNQNPPIEGIKGFVEGILKFNSPSNKQIDENIEDNETMWKMPTHKFNFEVYMKNPETGEDGWEIEFINVFATTKEEAKHKLDELVPDFDTIILFNYVVKMSEYDNDLFYDRGRHFYFEKK